MLITFSSGYIYIYIYIYIYEKLHTKVIYTSPEHCICPLSYYQQPDAVMLINNHNSFVMVLHVILLTLSIIHTY